MKVCFSSMACSAALIAGFCLGTVVLAGDGNAGGKKVSKSDQQFAVKAAQGGMTEVELGRLAADKASSPEVKQFGQRMVDDHSKANEELKAAASQAGITLPADAGAKGRAEVARFRNLSGEAFDRAYMQHMVMDHKKDVTEFQKQANTGSEPNLKEFASKTLPTLQEHLRMAQEVSSKSGSSTADRQK